MPFRIMKKPRLLLGLIVLIACSTYGVLLFNNNRNSVPLKNEVLADRLEKSIRWIIKNEQQVLADSTPMLWWMVIEAAKIRRDPRLISLANKFAERYPSVLGSLWGPLFGRERAPYVDPEAIADLPYYNQHIIYALHGAKNLVLTSEIVRRQNDASFCNQLAYFFRPACTTHQLMGIHFLGRSTGLDNAAIVGKLHKDIIRQLVWDVRVIDVYLQRVMMLVLTGAQNKVKPSWMRQIVEHQLEDGGWSNSMPLFPVGNGRFFVLDSRGISLDTPTSSFHTTVQGMLLLSVMTPR